jgi:Tfp pilus assembly PilM family ATPase
VFKNHTGISLSESKLQLVEIGYKDDSFILENVDQTIHHEGLTPTLKEEKIISIIQESFNKLIRKRPLASKSISFALPNNFFKIFEVPYDDSLVKKDLYEHLRWEISILFPESDKDNFHIQLIHVDKCTVRNEKNVIVFAIDKNLITAINKFCIQNRFDLKYIDNVHLASNAFLFVDKPQKTNEISLSLYIDSKYSSISALEGANPFYFKVLNPDSNILEEITEAMRKMEEFNLSLNDFKKILLYGQDLTSEFENKLENYFGSILKRINPFEHLKIEESLLNNPLYKMKFNSFTAAAGIAIRIV